ncbi:MAG TPA: amidohydrolase family protein [Planctomycetota bacterium]|nr:amidohydrolase family protein [Planctomycetota bacterium]
MPPPRESPVPGPVLIRGARVIDPRERRLETRDVLLEAGVVARIAADIAPPAGAEVLDAPGRILLPGWIDIQVNDIAWLARGISDPAETEARVREVAAYQAARGVTGIVLATLAAPIEEVIAYLRGVRRVLDAPASPPDHALIGALVEGTFMNPALSGAQNPRWVLPPDLLVLDRLVETGAVRLLNVAPETGPDALRVIESATRRGIIVGSGHAKPHARTLREAVKAGLRYVIHLGNGPTGSSLKAFEDGGMLEESLRNDDLIVSIILDGIHIDPRLARDWIARKEVRRVVAVSDAGFALGAPPGAFEVLGIRGERSACGKYLRVVPPAGAPVPNPRSSDFGALFGSAAAMQDIFANALNLFTSDMEGIYHRRHAPMGFEEALDAASALCSRNPAALLGLESRGDLATGHRADLVLVEIHGEPGAHEVAVLRTWVAGATVAERTP